MKILVTGRSGQLARSLAEHAPMFPGIDIIAIGRPQLDLAVLGTAEKAIFQHRPDLVINAAADTDVDGAEEHQQLAMRLNAEAAGEVAAAAASVEAPVIQLSTDYVFDGKASAPYGETAPVNPVNAYGRTKLAGEEAVRSANRNHLIVRTAWVYSPFGRNFVKTMFDAAEERDELRVVADQRGSPTSALDLADALMGVVQIWLNGGTVGRGQVYHLAGSGEASWHELAAEMIEQRRKLGLRAPGIIPIPWKEWPMRAVRPNYSALDNSKFERDFGIRLPGWRQSVGEVVKRLAAR
jgi:dTDP-4-dehydrorhamnose reductase